MTPVRDCEPLVNGLCKHKIERRHSLAKNLGPGFVTGASDDDPAGLTTYAQAGAQFGNSILWLTPWTLPLMICVQEMAARIGLMTQGGLILSLTKKFPLYIVYFMVGSLVTANTINIGADIAGMAESVHMTTGIPFYLAAVILSIGMLLLQIYLPYKKYIKVLKWCAISLLSYIVAAFMIKIGWKEVLWDVFIPTINITSNNFWYITTAILGTTISPYLLFWQANQELEEKRVRDAQNGQSGYMISNCEIYGMREETIIGMLFSNIIMFFVMVVTAAVLHTSGGPNNINTMVEAAQALRPLAGDFAAWLFAAGIIGTGLLTVPVLAGASAYAMAELLGWRHGLHLQWHKARKFYSIIALSTIIGLALNALKINAVDFLLWSAIINACVTPIIIIGIIVIANDGLMLGRYKNSLPSKIGAWTTCIVFVGSIIGFLVTYKK